MLKEKKTRLENKENLKKLLKKKNLVFNLILPGNGAKNLIRPMGLVKSFILKYAFGSDCKYTILPCSILSGIEPQGVWKNTKF